MADGNRTSLRQRKKISKNRVIAILVALLILTILVLSLMYGAIRDDAKVIKKMKIYNLSGSSATLAVDGVTCEYNGLESYLGEGTFVYKGNAKGITSYGYSLFLQEPGKNEEVVLLSNQVIGGDPDLSLPDEIGTIQGKANSNIDFAKFADKYTIGFRLLLTTTSGLITEEVFLKVDEVNTDFFRDVKI